MPIPTDLHCRPVPSVGCEAFESPGPNLFTSTISYAGNTGDKEEMPKSRTPSSLSVPCHDASLLCSKARNLKRFPGFSALPGRAGLYDSRHEKDGCGVGK